MTFTLQKAEADYSPTTMYMDYAMAPDLVHWETQSTTSDTSPTGRRYLTQRDTGTHVFLFARQTSDDEIGARPYVFLGPASYVSHNGSRPIAITWRLDHPMPADSTRKHACSPDDARVSETDYGSSPRPRRPTRPLWA